MNSRNGIYCFTQCLSVFVELDIIGQYSAMQILLCLRAATIRQKRNALPMFLKPKCARSASWWSVASWIERLGVPTNSLVKRKRSHSHRITNHMALRLIDSKIDQNMITLPRADQFRREISTLGSAAPHELAQLEQSTPNNPLKL